MPIETSSHLATFFREETGNALRLVAHYDVESIDFVYLREDLEERYSTEDFEQTFAVHRRENEDAAKQAAVIDAGKHHCTLRVFDGAIVFNFSQSEGIGTIVSLDPEVGRNLLAFITECLRELDRSSPQAVSVPKWVM